ncbi:MAG TPA: hypothetical protein VFW01_02905 [bacterium]|nr:hypothetical protein [bacterium]
MRNKSQHTRRQDRAYRPAVDIRALLRDREFIKVTAFVLPTPTKRQVLEMMERLRRERMTNRSGQPLPDPAVPLPEMTDGEMVREINWRIGTLPPQDAEVIAWYIRRLSRWRSERRTRAAETRKTPAAASLASRPD